MGATKSDRAMWLESQYNNRALVPAHPQILSRWAAESAAVRQSRLCRTDLAYGGAPSERLDLFLPKDARKDAGKGAPVLVFIHGGWWRALDKADHSFVSPAFTDAGSIVVVPNYALCPSVTIEHIVLQMARVIVWVWRHVQAHGGDPARIVVAGHSAGGHLAAMLLTCRWRQLDPTLPEQLLRSAVAVSGVFDLEPLRQTPFLQQDLKLTRASARRLSPARLPAPAAPLYAVAGSDESDEFQRQRALLQRNWGATAVPVCEAVPGTNHFTVLDELVRPGSRLHATVEDCLDRA